MAIERTAPMKIHKNIVIRFLTEHPEELHSIAKDWTGTVDEFIAAMEADPHEWIVGGELCE